MIKNNAEEQIKQSLETCDVESIACLIEFFKNVKDSKFKGKVLVDSNGGCDEVSQKVLQCEQCDYQFVLISSIRTHWHREHERLKCVCHHCGKPFIVKANLNEHIRKKHELYPEKCFKCSTCDKKFAIKSKTFSHIHDV